MKPTLLSTFLLWCEMWNLDVFYNTAVIAFAATVSPLADVQFISARDGEGGASRDSDGFDELDWTVWNRITLWLDGCERGHANRELAYGYLAWTDGSRPLELPVRSMWKMTEAWTARRIRLKTYSESLSVKCGICIKPHHISPVASPSCRVANRTRPRSPSKASVSAISVLRCVEAHVFKNEVLVYQLYYRVERERVKVCCV